MARDLTIAIVGAGSSYTPELICGLLLQTPEELPIARIRLHDIDADRLAIMTGFSRRAFRHGGREMEVVSDTRLEPMLEGADFVMSQIRVGGMKARHLDESIPLKYGIIGQETTGPGGMCKALRTIPHMIEIGRTVARVAPDAFILNYTNPSGIVTEAVTRYTEAKFIGLCSGIPGTQRNIISRFAEQYPDLKTYSVGLNHFGYIYRMAAGGRDVTAEILAQLDADEGVSAATSERRLLGAVPISYANYFLHRGQQVAKAQAHTETRAQEVARLEQDVLGEAADENTVTKPKALASRGGGGYAPVTFSVLKAIVHDTGEEITASVPNRGTVQGLEDEAAVEVTCRMDRQGAHPLPVGPIPLAFRGLVQALKAYETLTVEAAVHRDRRLARLALLNHPLTGDLDVIVPLLDEMLSAHGLEFT